MSDGSDGASSASDSSRSSTESQRNEAKDALSDVKDALGQVADALGLDSLAENLGLDTKDLQGVLGAALMGAMTGGLVGAVVGVVNALTGGSLVDSAHDAIDNLPEPLQPLARMAVDKFAGTVPGLTSGLNPQQAALAEFANGNLTNGRVPSMEDVATIARDLLGVNDAAAGLIGDALSGNLTADNVADVLDDALGVSFEDARSVINDVAAAMESGNGVYATGGRGDFGDAVERLAVSVVQVMSRR